MLTFSNLEGLELILRISVLAVSVNVYVPKDRVTNLHQGYGFVEFRSEEDADYVSRVLVFEDMCIFRIKCFQL